MSESIKILTKTVADYVGTEGTKYMSKSYTDIIYPPKESDKNADEIIDDIKRKLKEYE